MLFSCTVCDRIGDNWRYKNFVYIKNLTHYTQGSVKKIIIYAVLGIMSQIFLCRQKVYISKYLEFYLSTSQKSDSLYPGKCKLLSYLHFPGYNESDF